jgi:hypothetical protein
MSLSQPIGQALTPKKNNLIAPLLVVVGIIVCFSAAAYGYIESQRTEKVVIAARDVPYGRQIVADDLAVIELPLHRPLQVAGITDPSGVIGQYATRQIGTDDILKPTMLKTTPPDRPVYPNGRELAKDMVPVPFSLAALGPITDRDLVNIGFTTTDASLCDRQAADVPVGTVLPPPAAVVEGNPEAGAQALPRAFACRFMSNVNILYIDGSTAYLEMSPAQAHAMWALTAAGVTMWGERYGSTSTPLMFMDRLDAGQVTIPDLTAPVTDTLRIEPKLVNPASATTPSGVGQGASLGGAVPAANTTIPGANTLIPGSAPAATPATSGAAKP